MINPMPRHEEKATLIELPASSKSCLPKAFDAMIDAPDERSMLIPEINPTTGKAFCIADTASGPINCPIRTLSTVLFMLMIAMVAMDARRNRPRLLLIR